MTATTRFNQFGATPTQLLALYPGTVLADYDGGGVNGSAVITDALARISREVASSFTPEVYMQLTQVDCEWLVRYATLNQATSTFGITPIMAGTAHLWLFPSLASMNSIDIWRQSPIYYVYDLDFFYRKPVKGYNELLLGQDYSISGSTVTWIRQLNAGERIYATYDVNNADSAFAMPSVGDMVLLGAAAELGSRLYSEATQEWKLVTQYSDRYKAWLTSIGKGEWIPDELRALNYWKEVERKSDANVDSVRNYRM